MDFPIEILLKITDCLSPYDIISLLHTSFECYNKFNNNMIWEQANRKLQYPPSYPQILPAVEDACKEFTHCENLQNFMCHLYVQTCWRDEKFVLTPITGTDLKEMVECKKGLEISHMDCNKNFLVVALVDTDSRYSISSLGIKVFTITSYVNFIGHFNIDFEVKELKLHQNNLYICSATAVMCYLLPLPNLNSSSLNGNIDDALYKRFHKDFSFLGNEGLFEEYKIAVCSDFLFVVYNKIPVCNAEILNRITGTTLRSFETPENITKVLKVFVTGSYAFIYCDLKTEGNSVLIYDIFDNVLVLKSKDYDPSSAMDCLFCNYPTYMDSDCQKIAIKNLETNSIKVIQDPQRYEFFYSNFKHLFIPSYDPTVNIYLNVGQHLFGVERPSSKFPRRAACANVNHHRPVLDSFCPALCTDEFYVRCSKGDIFVWKIYGDRVEFCYEIPIGGVQYLLYIDDQKIVGYKSSGAPYWEREAKPHGDSAFFIIHFNIL